MAKNETLRIRPSLLQDDRDGFAALKELSDYRPANAAFSVANVQAAQDAMVAKRDIEAQRQAALDTARDEATAAEWNFHNAMLEAKGQVRAQYGVDSNQVQSLGLKKKSEYKSPGPKTPPAKNP